MFRLSTLVNGIYWECANMRDAFESAVNVSRSIPDVIIVQNTANNRVCTIVNGTVSLYIRDGQEDMKRWK